MAAAGQVAAVLLLTLLPVLTHVVNVKEPSIIVKQTTAKHEIDQMDLLSIDKQSENVNDSPSKRQKRWNSLFGSNFPFPSAPGLKSDDLFSSEGYGSPSFVRHAVTSFLAPPAFHQPFIIPVFFVPQVSCTCPQPTDNKTDKGEMPSDISNRFPDLEDTRQNWGISGNGTDRNTDDELKPRPISFIPVPPRRPSNRPPPSIDHVPREPAPGPPGPPPRPQSSLPPAPPPRLPPAQPSATQPPAETPTPCDIAILSCCHQKDVTIECFGNFGCPNVGSSNPCDPQLIREVVEVFRRYYGP